MCKSANGLILKKRWDYSDGHTVNFQDGKPKAEHQYSKMEIQKEVKKIKEALKNITL